MARARAPMFRDFPKHAAAATWQDALFAMAKLLSACAPSLDRFAASDFYLTAIIASRALRSVVTLRSASKANSIMILIVE
jgi:hypothetical protein